MGIRFVAFVIGIGALWDGFTTLFGIDEMLRIVTADGVDYRKGIFAVVVSLVVFGFMLATHTIWAFTSDDLVTVLLRMAWFICFGIDLYTSMRGNAYYVFQNKIEGGVELISLFIVTFLITASTILMSRLLLSRDATGKSYLF